MSINGNDDDRCLTPLIVPFSFWAGRDVIVCNLCCDIFSTQINNRKFYVFNIEHSISGLPMYVYLSIILG